MLLKAIPPLPYNYHPKELFFSKGKGIASKNVTRNQMNINHFYIKA